MLIPKRTKYRKPHRLSYEGKKIEFNLTDELGIPLRNEDLYVAYFGENCKECGNKMICNGCSKCGKCYK